MDNLSRGVDPLSEDYVTVVSGAPRSGTSMMMRMLEAGGMPILTDGRRAPDRNNPHGYFEYEAVKSLGRDSSWIGSARGKAVKIVYRLLPNLPAGIPYRVLLMDRDFAEIFDSQQDLLEDLGSGAAHQDRDRMIRAMAADLDRTIDRIRARNEFRIQTFSYRDAITDPTRVADRVAAFLDRPLHLGSMAAAVDPKLYRRHNLLLITDIM